MKKENNSPECIVPKETPIPEYHDGDFDVTVWQEEIPEIIADQMEEDNK